VISRSITLLSTLYLYHSLTCHQYSRLSNAQVEPPKKHLMKAALKQGVENGSLVQVKASYKLSSDEKKKLTKPAVVKKAAAPKKKAAAPKKKVRVKLLLFVVPLFYLSILTMIPFRRPLTNAQQTTVKKTSGATKKKTTTKKTTVKKPVGATKKKVCISLIVPFRALFGQPYEPTQTHSLIFFVIFRRRQPRKRPSLEKRKRLLRKPKRPSRKPPKPRPRVLRRRPRKPSPRKLSLSKSCLSIYHGILFVDLSSLLVLACSDFSCGALP